MSKKQQKSITFDDFDAYRPMHNYIFTGPQRGRRQRRCQAAANGTARR